MPWQNKKPVSISRAGLEMEQAYVLEGPAPGVRGHGHRAGT